MFSENFAKFLVQLFQNTPMKLSVISLAELWGAEDSPVFCVILEIDFTRDNFLKFLQKKLSPEKPL